MRKYLFVIDYQNDFVDGALGFPGAEKLDGPIVARINEALARDELFSGEADGYVKSIILK